MTEPSGSKVSTTIKTWAVLLFFLALKAGGNSSMAVGMKQVPEKMSINPALYLHAMLNPFVALGVVASDAFAPHANRAFQPGGS